MNLEQAKRIYSAIPEYRDTLLKDFSDEDLGIKPKYAKRWNELPEGQGVYYINGWSGIFGNVYKPLEGFKSSLPTKEKAESVLAYCQLSMVYHQYPKGEKKHLSSPDFYTIHIPAFNDQSHGVKLLTFTEYVKQRLLDFTFLDKDLCQEFIDNNMDLLLTWFKGR